jgi:hypothetical protein
MVAFNPNLRLRFSSSVVDLTASSTFAGGGTTGAIFGGFGGENKFLINPM